MNYFGFDIVLNSFDCQSSRTCSPSGRLTIESVTSFPIYKRQRSQELSSFQDHHPDLILDSFIFTADYVSMHLWDN